MQILSVMEGKPGNISFHERTSSWGRDWEQEEEVTPGSKSEAGRRVTFTVCCLLVPDRIKTPLYEPYPYCQPSSFPVHCCLLGHNIPDFLQIYDHFFTLFFKVTTWFWSCKTCSLLLLTQFIKWQQNAGNSVLESAHICMPVCLCCTQWRMALSLSCLSVMNNLPRRCRSH